MVGENIAQIIKRLQLESGKTLSALSEELDIPRTSLKKYASGKSNPRADTLALLSKKLNVSITEIVSDPPQSCEQAETIVRAARIFSSLTPERQKVGAQLFAQLVILFSEA